MNKKKREKIPVFILTSRSSDSGDNFTRSAVAEAATLGATLSE